LFQLSHETRSSFSTRWVSVFFCLSCLACTVNVYQTKPSPNAPKTSPKENPIAVTKTSRTQSATTHQPRPKVRPARPKRARTSTPKARRSLRPIRRPKKKGASTQPRSTEVFITVAPRGMNCDMLGKPFDRNFAQIPAGRIFKREPKVFEVPQHSFSHQFRLLESEYEIDAAVRIFNLQAQAFNSTAYAIYSAQQISTACVLNEDVAPTPPWPSDAIFYPIKMYRGRIYSVALAGHSSRLNAQAESSILSFGGNINAYAKRSQLTFRAYAKGLKPRSNTAIFAKTPSEIEKNYVQTSDPSSPVILVEWRLLPGRKNKKTPHKKPKPSTCTVIELYKIRWDIPPRKPNGYSWDWGFNSVPDVEVFITSDSGKRTLPKKSTFRYEATIRPPFTLTPGQTFVVEGRDLDGAMHDKIGLFESKPIWPSDVRQGKIDLNSGSIQVFFRCRD